MDKEEIVSTDNLDNSCPSTRGVAQYVREALSEVTELPPSELDMEQSLFEMGVDSANLAEMVTQIEAEFNFSFGQADMQGFMANPTLERLVTAIETARKSQGPAGEGYDADHEETDSDAHSAIQLY
ncbi:MAG: hypothetical protein GF344_20185 [Chitinivibrionales bacterium]|nr:hypothetical protein [Chitinivibrionales bacterium]MBD3358932.1 hypothetical protein [Chitinivibrionales bacterium]